jgi:site-specific recombinase XerD
MLKLRVGKHPYVFPGRYKNAHVNNPTRPFQEALDRAGLPRKRIHDMRHNFASHMVQSGATLYDVQKTLGHSTSTMTQRFAHLAEKEIRERQNQAASRMMDGGSSLDAP